MLISKGVRVTVFLTVQGLFSLLVVFPVHSGETTRGNAQLRPRQKQQSQQNIPIDVYVFADLFPKHGRNAIFSNSISYVCDVKAERGGGHCNAVKTFGHRAHQRIFAVHTRRRRTSSSESYPRACTAINARDAHKPARPQPQPQ